MTLKHWLQTHALPLVVILVGIVSTWADLRTTLHDVYRRVERLENVYIHAQSADMICPDVQMGGGSFLAGSSQWLARSDARCLWQQSQGSGGDVHGTLSVASGPWFATDADLSDHRGTCRSRDRPGSCQATCIFTPIRLVAP